MFGGVGRLGSLLRCKEWVWWKRRCELEKEQGDRQARVDSGRSGGYGGQRPMQESKKARVVKGAWDF